MSFEISDTGNGSVHIEVYLEPADVDLQRVGFLVANWDGWKVVRLELRKPSSSIPVASKEEGIALAKQKIIEIVQAGHNRIAVQLEEMEAQR